jgi:hypothetical protein
MKCLVALILFFSAVTLRAQVVDASACDILADPQSFDGKMVRLKGTVVAGFDDFLIKPSGCNQVAGAIWLAYPEGAKAKAGPVAFVQLQLGKNNSESPASVNRSTVTLDKNKESAFPMRYRRTTTRKVVSARRTVCCFSARSMSIG